MEYVVDINCDMGESFGNYSPGNDSKVARYITSSSIACGFHASDPDVMETTVALCKKNNIMVGAHPGYPDITGFGRRFMDLNEHELINCIIYQIGALKGFLNLHSMPLQHVKLHGALYNFMVNQEDLFFKIAVNVKKAFGDIVFFTLGTKKAATLKKVWTQKGAIKIALEAFPDRAYTDEGELLPRMQKEAVIHNSDQIANRAVKMVKERGIESINGHWIDMDIDTICMHGDNSESIDAAGKIHERLSSHGVTIKPVSGFL